MNEDIEDIEDFPQATGRSVCNCVMCSYIQDLSGMSSAMSSKAVRIELAKCWTLSFAWHMKKVMTLNDKVVSDLFHLGHQP